MQSKSVSDDTMALHPDSVPSEAIELKRLKRQTNQSKLQSALSERKGKLQEVQYGTSC